MTFGVLIFLFLSCARCWLTVVTTFLINEDLFRGTGQKQANFKTWLTYSNTTPEWQWLVLATGNCSVLQIHAPHLQCHALSPAVHSLEFSLPFVNSILKKARMLVRTRYMMFSNMGNIIFGDLRRIVNAVKIYSQLPHLFISSRPIAVHTNRAFDFRDERERGLFFKLERSEFHWFGWACEAFIIDRLNPLIDRMPPFLIGRIRWDNWIMQFAGMHNLTTSVDATGAMTILHMNHGENGTYDSSAHSAPGTDYNEQLAISSGNYFYGNLVCLGFVVSDDFKVARKDLSQCKQFVHPTRFKYDDIKKYVNS
jgi:hypothetical protein